MALFRIPTNARCIVEMVAASKTSVLYAVWTSRSAPFRVTVQDWKNFACVVSGSVSTAVIPSSRSGSAHSFVVSVYWNRVERADSRRTPAPAIISSSGR